MLIFTKQEDTSFIRKFLCSKLPPAAIKDKSSAQFQICSQVTPFSTPYVSSGTVTASHAGAAPARRRIASAAPQITWMSIINAWLFRNRGSDWDFKKCAFGWNPTSERIWKSSTSSGLGSLGSQSSRGSKDEAGSYCGKSGAKQGAWLGRKNI